MAMTSLQRQVKEREEQYRNIGFSIWPNGIGDGLQYSSLPENFYRATGNKLIDVSKPWYLDFNPYVDRESSPKRVQEMWNYPKKYDWPKPRKSVYLSNAEIHLNVFGLQNPKLIRPRLYRFEEFSYKHREMILFQPQGQSHGRLPDYVIDHVLKKYKDCLLIHVGLPNDPDIGLPRVKTPTLWHLAELISKAKMLIAPDSGPAWIGACYPDVLVKKIRTKFQHGFVEPKDWVPLDVQNDHAVWDDQGLFQIYNIFEEDCGFTQSYKKL